MRGRRRNTLYSFPFFFINEKKGGIHPNSLKKILWLLRNSSPLSAASAVEFAGRVVTVNRSQ